MYASQHNLLPARHLPIGDRGLALDFAPRTTCLVCERYHTVQVSLEADSPLRHCHLHP